MGAEREARLIRVFGIVQGVGFRPFVYRLAGELGLTGWVRNTSGDVTIHAEGSAESLLRLENAIVSEAPPLARLERVVACPADVRGYAEFAIDVSEAAAGEYQPVSPDVATCADCAREALDAADRRYLYPFTNCTNCGPRYTIIERVPYDRGNTTMSGFTMCPACQAEYDDPADRRFHAQPTACPACGPHLWLEVEGRRLADGDLEAIALATSLLLEGKIVALKGLGGFHLAVDAGNDAAVAELRRRKRRPHRALALMMADVAMVRRYCRVSPEAEATLTSPASPIALLPPLPEADRRISPLVAPDNDRLGVMLPYTPLHYLLLCRVGLPLVMTSGNLSEEPLAVDNEEALRRLGHIADAFLLHDRPIHMPCDDSVVALTRQAPAAQEVAQVVRRARGYAPAPLRLPSDAPQLLAVGPEMKATVCLARDNLAFLSQHLGELSNYETWEHYLRVVGQFESLFHVCPELIAHDQHPDYMSTLYALERAESQGLRSLAVQHHHAHALSCLADAGRDPAEPVLAVVLDGTGYGGDGRVWGGEWLLVRGASYERLAHLEYLPLAGGEAAIEHVDRLALGYLLSRGMVDQACRLPALRDLAQAKGPLVAASLGAQTTALTSSMGRLFDAAAGMLGLAREVTYEAQAAIRLETLARRSGAAQTGECYGWTLEEDGAVTLTPLLAELAADVLAGREAPAVALRFHHTVCDMIVTLAAGFAAKTGVRTVALSGGCYQNTLLTELCLRRLADMGLEALIHHRVPCNDGGVALGQAVAARLAIAAEAV